MHSVELKHTDSDTDSALCHYVMLNQRLALHSCFIPFMPAKVRELLSILFRLIRLSGELLPFLIFPRYAMGKVRPTHD